jgi:uncharacterized protein YcfL
MKIKLCSIAILVSLAAYGCSSKNNSEAVDTETVLEDKTELALVYCRKLIAGFTGNGSEIFDPSTAQNYLIAARKEHPQFYQADGSGFRKKKEVEFASIFEESLFDCEKELDRHLSDLLKAI